MADASAALEAEGPAPSLAFRAVRRFLTLLFVVGIALALAAGCGVDDEKAETADTKPTPAARPSPLANAAYERAYTECSSFTVRRLAAKYKTRPIRGNIAKAAGDYWAGQLGGDQSVAAYAEAGCKDGMRDRVADA